MMEPANDIEECGNCLHWDPESGGRGLCRRHAPAAGVLRDLSPIDAAAVWPRTKADDWCGEFKGQGG